MSATAARAATAYQHSQVQSRSPLELVVMLYDGAVASIAKAQEGLERRNFVAKRDGLSRALAIVSELQSSLDFDQGGEVARQLDSLYVYVTGRLIESNISADLAALVEARQIMTTLRDAWRHAVLPGDGPGGAQERP